MSKTRWEKAKEYPNVTLRYITKEESDEIERRRSVGELESTVHPDEAIVVDMNLGYGAHVKEDIIEARK